MIRPSLSPYVLLSLVAGFATLPGCQTDGRWQRLTVRDKPQVAASDESHFARRDSLGTGELETPGIRPGHSTDVDWVNEDFRDTSRPGVTERLIKSLRPTKLFTPDANRTIHDHLRRQQEVETQDAPTPPPTGPIARLPVREPTTRACQYSEVQELVACPVRLGLPEPILDDAGDTILEQHEEVAGCRPPGPVIMQATPSSFVHPLLADPTGVPYPNQTGL
jgi:hypothetical protein